MPCYRGFSCLKIAALTRQSGVPVLLAASELGDTKSAARAVALVDGMDDAVRRHLLSQAVARHRYDQLVVTNDGQQVPRDWHDWLIGDRPDRPDVLSEWAASWAGQWIEEQWPGVDITLAHDHVNSDRLEAMAHNCDVVVVQTSHAKHAAVAALEAAAGPGGDLLKVHGRGATSLVRALLERASDAA